MMLSFSQSKMRSEREMEEILHKYRVVARKRQIQLLKDDNEIPYRPYSLPAYVNTKQREKIFDILILKLKILLP